ncbi:hypothetical protein pb186bvf_010547 [Paramecium bursaria]
MNYRSPMLIKSKQTNNLQHAPPDSLQESINESSVCNIDDSKKDIYDIQNKAIILQNHQRQQVQALLKQQKEKIFSQKHKTQDDGVRSSYELHKNLTGAGDHQKKNPFASRKVSEIAMNSERESLQRQSSYIQQPMINKQMIKPPSQPLMTPYNAKLYTQLAAQIETTAPIISVPKKVNSMLQSQQSLQSLQKQINIQTVTTNPEESNQKISSPVGKKFRIFEEKSESFQNIMQLKSQSKDKNSQYDEQEILNDFKKIETFLSNPNILQIYNAKPFELGGGVKSETNLLSNYKINAFKKQPNYQKLIIKALFDNDKNKFVQYMQESKGQFVDTPDCLGNTLLILVIKLCGSDTKYNDLLKELLKYNPNPFLKNKITGWSAMDESLSQRSIYATALLFQQCYKVRRNQFSTQYETLIGVLDQVPNFSMDMNWNFDSPLPFVKLIAPNDTIRLWKFNQNLRLDSTLVGFSKLQCKRRNMSLIFAGKNLLQINRTNNFYTDPLEELDLEERKMVIHDILNCEPVNGALDIISCQLKEVLDWRGKRTFENIGPYKTEKYDLKITFKSTISKKQNDTQQKFMIEKELYTEWLDNNISPNTNILITTKPQEQTETRTISIWICKNHFLRFQDFNNIVSFLAKGNPLLDKLSKVFERPEVQQIMSIDGFPVKVQIPFQFSIYATIQFQNFSPLNSKLDYFDIPKQFKYKSRKLAQKTLENKQKRLLLANLYI